LNEEKEAIMSKAVFCVVNTHDHAELIIDHLKAVGFPADAISALLSDPDHKRNLDFALKHGTKAPEGTTAGASTGGLLGAGLGWAAGIGALAIPGIGPLVAAGPILAALSGAAVGAMVGGIAGALIGMGIPEFEAKLYEGRVKAGGILLAVQCRDSDQVDRAKEVLREGGAHDITTTDATKIGSKR
jgi:hypothetical protein